MGNCIHGLNSLWCSDCNPRESKTEKREPRVRTVTTMYGAGSRTVKQAFTNGYAVIRTAGSRKLTRSHLESHLSFVHIDGFPYLWAIEMLLNSLPNLKTIQITPKMERRLGKTHKELCLKQGVEIVFGYHRPELAWKKGENRSPFYKQQKEFLKNLKGEQKELFEELIKLGFKEAMFVSRYFCLNGEDFKYQLEVADELDLSDLSQVLSEYLNAVFLYLDPDFKVGEGTIGRTERIKRQVLRLRKIIIQALSEEEIAKQIGLKKLPENMPLSRLDILESVVRAYKDKSFIEFSKKFPNGAKVLILRFGLEDFVYRTLENIGQLMGGLTRERIRQIEERALILLSIEPD